MLIFQHSFNLTDLNINQSELNHWDTALQGALIKELNEFISWLHKSDLSLDEQVQGLIFILKNFTEQKIFDEVTKENEFKNFSRAMLKLFDSLNLLYDWNEEKFQFQSSQLNSKELCYRIRDHYLNLLQFVYETNSFQDQFFHLIERFPEKWVEKLRCPSIETIKKHYQSLPLKELLSLRKKQNDQKRPNNVFNALLDKPENWRPDDLKKQDFLESIDDLLGKDSLKGEENWLKAKSFINWMLYLTKDRATLQVLFQIWDELIEKEQKWKEELDQTQALIQKNYLEYLAESAKKTNDFKQFNFSNSELDDVGSIPENNIETEYHLFNSESISKEKVNEENKKYVVNSKDSSKEPKIDNKILNKISNYSKPLLELSERELSDSFYLFEVFKRAKNDPNTPIEDFKKIFENLRTLESVNSAILLDVRAYLYYRGCICKETDEWDGDFGKLNRKLLFLLLRDWENSTCLSDLQKLYAIGLMIEKKANIELSENPKDLPLDNGLCVSRIFSTYKKELSELQKLEDSVNDYTQFYFDVFLPVLLKAPYTLNYFLDFINSLPLEKQKDYYHQAANEANKYYKKYLSNSNNLSKILLVARRANHNELKDSILAILTNPLLEKEGIAKVENTLRFLKKVDFQDCISFIINNNNNPDKYNKAGLFINRAINVVKEDEILVYLYQSIEEIANVKEEQEKIEMTLEEEELQEAIRLSLTISANNM